jgi:hypothetical protein
MIGPVRPAQVDDDEYDPFADDNDRGAAPAVVTCLSSSSNVNSSAGLSMLNTA